MTTATAVTTADPASLVVAANVRKDVKLTPEFVASQPADHWSYNNSGVQERVSPEGRRYSLDIEQYEPRCVVCHSRFDAAARSAS